MLAHTVKDGYFILFALHIYIWVIRTFSLSGQVSVPSIPEKQGSSVFVIFSCLPVLFAVIQP